MQSTTYEYLYICACAGLHWISSTQLLTSSGDTFLTLHQQVHSEAELERSQELDESFPGPALDDAPAVPNELDASHRALSACHSLAIAFPSAARPQVLTADPYHSFLAPDQPICSSDSSRSSSLRTFICNTLLIRVYYSIIYKR